MVGWMRDIRTTGPFIDLPKGTAMAVLGDLNIVHSFRPVATLLSGDIDNNAAYGPDSAPDWDGSTNADLHPLHNAYEPFDYTWRNDNGSFAAGRLDLITWTDSALRRVHSFVLNTTMMSSTALASSGLQEFDITVDNSGNSFDHLPLVVDFRPVKRGPVGHQVGGQAEN